MQGLAKRAREKWQLDGVAVRLPVSDADLTAFEAEHRVKLPEDLRSFYSVAGGALGEDADHLRIWPLEELALAPDSSRLWVFADYLALSHAFAIDLSPDADATVFLVGGPEPITVAPSFTSFLIKYLDSPDDLTVT